MSKPHYDLRKPEPVRKSDLKPPTPEQLALLSNLEALKAMKEKVDKEFEILFRPFRLNPMRRG